MTDFERLYASGSLISAMDFGIMVANKVSREWDEASKSWTDFVRKGKDYYPITGRK